MPSAAAPHRTGRLKLPQGTVFWHEGGTPGGEVVVLLHGSWQDSGQWLPLLPALAPRFHCLAPDLLGFGESSAAPAYSVALQVDGLRQWLGALRIDRCHLVGHSLGAWVAGQYALTYPDQVQSLTVIAPEGVSDGALAGRWRRDRWLVAPWSPLPLVLPWLGKRGAALRDRRRLLRQFPAACELLFRRRPAALAGEQLQSRLGQLTVPLRVLEPDPCDPTTRHLGNLWLRHQPQGKLQVLPAAPGLGIDGMTLAKLLEELPLPNPRVSPVAKRGL